LSKDPSRYSQFLQQIEAHAIKTVSAIIFLALLADFALKELQPIFKSIWRLLGL
jgi:hypothetical protein